MTDGPRVAGSVQLTIVNWVATRIAARVSSVLDGHPPQPYRYGVE